MISRLLSLIISIALIEAAVVQNRSQYDIYGGYKHDKYYNYNPDCCLVPTCNYGKCYDSIECGHVCSTANYPKANVDRTPGYKKKDYYTEYNCHFGECSQFKFTCGHCPNPDEYNFSIYTTRKDCLKCYE